MVEPDNPYLDSLTIKGEASYYYAHASRKEDVEALGGESIVSGGNPQLLVSQAPRPKHQVNVNIRNYSWRDIGSKVAVYIPLIKQISPEAVTVNFSTQALQLSITYDDSLKHSLDLWKLMYPVEPDECTWQVRTNKLVLKLSKQDIKSTWHVLVNSS